MGFRLTPAVKNLLIINIVVYLLSISIFSWISESFALYFFLSENFMVFQPITYMFVHDTESIFHLVFNMIGLISLGPMLEYFWGTRKFMVFYLVTGFGAAIIYTFINAMTIMPMQEQVAQFKSEPSPDTFYSFISKTRNNSRMTRLYYNEHVQFYEQYDDNPNDEAYIAKAGEIMDLVLLSKINVPMVGASGAIYAILMAFGLLFPNTQLMLLFPPIPIKAKYLVLGLGALALYSGFQDNPEDNTAHFAHIGGMIVAYLVIKFWQKNSKTFY